MLSEQEKKPRKHRVFKALMAEAVGFEPTCPCGQLHFECSSLQPLRYASMYKYSLSRTNHMISSQSRYDHFDTAPYLSQHQHLRKRGELMGRTKKNIKLRIPEKPRKIKGFRLGSYRVATTISSQPRYDHFDTAAYSVRCYQPNYYAITFCVLQGLFSHSGHILCV